ncbi:MAG: hypothetical protein ACI9PY_003030 [Ascidiaceihabitans sp.]|jgi:hypothetical protein
MTWIASADHNEGRFSPYGLGVDRRAEKQMIVDPSSLLARGTIMLETRMSPNGKPQVLFSFKRDFPWSRSLSIQAIPGGGIALVHEHGDHVNHAALRWKGSGRADIVRITYAWDAPRGFGRLSLERPEDSTVTSVDIVNPKPLCTQDLHDVMLGKCERTLANDAVFVALSTEVEPVGPMPTLCPSTPILTPWGTKAAGTLQRGDTVSTPDDGAVPVLHSIKRTVPALGSFAPIRLRAPYFGLRRDIIAAPDQRLVIRGSDVEYMFGQESVLVPARHLVNGYAARYEPAGATVTYTHLLLPAHQSLMVSGSALESLYIGRIRRKEADLQASILAPLDRNSLPEHGKPFFPMLKAFEAIALAAHRAA